MIVCSDLTNTIKPENVFIVVNTFGRGGAEMSLAILAYELAKRGHKVTLLALWKDQNSYNFDWLTRGGVRLIILYEARCSLLFLIYKLFQLISLERPTLIYSAMLHANLISQICAKILGIKHIASVRINPSVFYANSLMKRTLFALIMWLQENIIFISHRALNEYLATIYGRGLKKKQVFVLHNPITGEEFLTYQRLVSKYLKIKSKINYLLNDGKTHHCEANTLRCVIASRMVDGKGVLEVLEQIKVSLSNPCIQLLIYGAGNLEDQVRSYVDREFANKSVIFKGFSTNLNEIYAESDIFIFPSRSEGFGRAPFEALFQGNLIICNSAVSIINEFLDDPNVWSSYPEPLDILNEIKKFANINPDACAQDVKKVSVLLSNQAHAIAFEKIASICIGD